jgi:hypothetical protein
MEAEKQIVLYFDYELQDKQFENRYSNNYEEHYSFDENFKRITINPDAEIPTDKFDEFLFIQMEECIKEYDAKIIIVDNLTWLRTESTEKVIYSKLHLVDLAGSERIKKSGASGISLKEATYINKSLTFLEQVVVSVCDNKRDHIPYRQSKLTNFLKNSIGGNC